MAKMSMRTASRSKANKFDLSSTHVLTQTFGQYRVTNYLPCVPGDKFNISYQQFTRLAPLVVPTFGNFKVKTYAFFVPYRVIWRGFESWYSESVDTSVYTNGAHTFTISTISDLFRSSSASGLTTDGTASNYDVCYVANSTSNDVIYRKLTNKGRLFVNILRGLGYNFPLAVNSSTGFHAKKLDALPLLAFARVLYDWLYPSVYVQQQGFGSIFDNSLSELNQGIMLKILSLIFCAYDNDYFTSSWLDFNSPAAGYNPFGVEVESADAQNVIISDKDSVSAIPGQDSALTSAGLRMLQSLSDYVTRNNIVGSRFFERVKARFGFTTQEQRHDFSSFLKVWSDDVNLMDVTATTSTASQNLGEQAGKGVSNGNGSLHFTANEHGALIFLSQIVPSIGYVQGMKPWCRAVSSPREWYTPEFDNVGNQPIPNSELFNDYMSNPYGGKVQTSWRMDGVFGFAPRYSEYKHGQDFLTGDFIFRDRNVGSEAYHTFRLFDGPTANNYTEFGIANDAEFRRVDSQYNRVFAVDPQDEGSSVYDHFFTIMRFNVVAYRHMLSISESIPLFDKSGRDTSFDYLGESFH